MVSITRFRAALPRRAVPLLAIAFAGLAADPAAAVDTTLYAGSSVTASDRYWSPAFYVDVAGERRQTGRFTWRPVASLGWVGARDERPQLDRDVVVAAAGVSLVDWWKRAFFSFQFGYANRTTEALSSHGQFISSLGWQGDRVALMVRHISNGNVFGGRNLGETMFMVGVTF
ncbi:MAG: lipid A 3-O-deacylase [Rhodanobacter denitrificans]|uniref:Lipid A 3-O-deacylase n=1 Tax=Rhodanobacter denitrificans TaxID=666685 RepID=A0A2W5MIW7_9GAMM|nr:MAG: lipid A 3-O-deacylase [Rhodanobacter denitrificans]